ncbi:hypothetical protein AAHA92_04614 [Salvia divinorum]|uniref:Uncharacterized protein n=1 Tax=Salvia divinorum TaxID=28513 RepID=A0ABD1HZS7_SALDI
MGDREKKKSFVKLSDVLVAYALFVMPNYLTHVWGLSSTHASYILSICNGVCRILPLFFLCLADRYLGHLKLLVSTSLAYVAGIMMVAVSTPRKRNRHMQAKGEHDDNTAAFGGRVGMHQIAGLLWVAVVSIAGAIAFPYIRPPTLKFGIPAICTLIGTLLFLTGYSNCTDVDPLYNSPLLNVFKVLIAASLKSF